MAQLMPPPPPPVLTAEDEGRQRLQFRQWQLVISILTILASVWLTTFGHPLLTICAWVIAKHILVALFMMGLHRYPQYKDELDGNASA
jgi:hypothetical protein